jgi:hypothetical protein
VGLPGWGNLVEAMAGDDLTAVVEVELDQQQDSLLRKIRRAGTHGATDEEVIRNLFRQFLRQHGLLNGQSQ